MKRADCYYIGQVKCAHVSAMTWRAVLGEIHAITLTELDGTDYEYNYEIDGEVKVDPYVRRLTGRCVWGNRRNRMLTRSEGFWKRKLMTGRTTNCRRMPIVMWLLIIFMSEDLRKIRILRFLQKGTFEGVIEKLPI